MRFLRPSICLIVFLIITISIPQSLFSQSGARPSPKPSASQRRQSIKPHGQAQRANALATVIGELLKLDPLKPGSLNEKGVDRNSETAEASSQKESNPPA